MRYRALGRTGLQVSAVSLGTVSLGLDYGIEAPGQFGKPDAADAIRLVRAAVDRGITLIDTAPAYGESEHLVGRAVGRDRRVIIATKVTPPNIDASLESSRRALHRDVIDIVQIHNATRTMLGDTLMIEALLSAKRRGVVRFLGASVYGEDAAMATIQSGHFDLLQVAFNALDQRMTRTVLPAAEHIGIGVLARSAFLKGALTPKAQWLPRSLTPLREAAERARDVLASGSWDRLPSAAMRFCLSVPQIASVLIGARTLGELDAAIAAERAGPLEPAFLTEAPRLALNDPELLDPSGALWASVP